MKSPHFPLVAIAAVMLLMACKPDPKSARWDTQALTPLVSTRLELSDILHDTSMTTAGDGLLSLYFKNRITELLPDEIMTPLNHEFQNTANLQSIELGNRSVTDHISLGDLAKGGTPEGQFIIGNHGNRAFSPPFSNVGRKVFAVDATEFFESIELISGDLKITFKNEIPVTLVDIEFRLENQASRDTIISALVDTLHPGQSNTQSFSLANKSISGELRAVLENFSSLGSDTNKVLIDTSDRVLVELDLSNLIPSAATAIFPDQVISQDTTDTEGLLVGNALLEQIRVANGKIFMEATSTIEDEIILRYEVPSFTKNGQPLVFTETLEGAPPGGTSNSYSEIDIQDYSADLTGRPDEYDVYNKFYSILISRIDSSGNLVHLSLDDSIFLRTGTTGLTAARGYGYLGVDTISASFSAGVDFFNMVDSGNFDLEDVRLGINVENFIGAPLSLYLNELRAKKGNAYTDLVWDSLGTGILVPPASLAGDEPVAAQVDIIIDKNSGNMDELLEMQPDSFLTDIFAVLNEQTPAPDFNQFIFAKNGIRSSLFIEVPLHLSSSGLTLMDTVDFDYSQYDENEQLQSGTLRLIGENNFPLEAQVELVLLGENGQELGNLTSGDKILAANTDAEGRAAGALKSTADYPLNRQKLEMLRETSQILFKVVLNTGSDKIRIYNTNYIDLTLAGDLTIRTQ